MSTTAPTPTSFSSLAFPLHININLALPAEVEAMALQINQKMLDLGHDTISFHRVGSDPLPDLPHITLLMGTVATAEDFAHIEAICAAFAAEESAVTYTCGPIYWDVYQHKFLFVDTLPTEALRAFRRRLHARLETLLQCDQYGGPDGVSHITCGFSQIPQSKTDTGVDVSDPLAPFAHIPIVPKATSNTIRICSTGGPTYGTCRTVLRGFGLGCRRV